MIFTLKKNEIIYIAFAIWLTNEVIMNSTYEHILGIEVEIINASMTVFVFFALLIQIIVNRKYRFQEILTISVISFFLLISAYNTGMLYFASTLMFVIALRNVDFDKLMKIALIVSVMATLFVVISCLLGAIDNVTVYRRGIIQRYSMGFKHPNRLGQRLFQIASCYLYVHRKTVGPGDLIFLSSLLVVSYAIPNSQTCMVGIGTLLIFLIVYYVWHKNSVEDISLFTKIILMGSAAFVNAFSIFMIITNVAHTKIGKLIDFALSKRFSHSHRVYELYGLSFFGQEIFVTEAERALVGIKDYLILDNGYAWTLLRFGIVTYSILSVGYVLMIKKALDMKEIVIAIIFVAYAAYGMMEIGVFLISYNVFLLFYSYLIYKNEGNN